MATRLAPGIRQRRPGTFEVRVYAGVDGRGRSQYLSRTITGTVKEANTLRAELVAEVSRKGAATTRTLGELFDAVLEHLEAIGREPTTLHDYRQVARRIDADLGRVSLRRLKASDLDRFYAELLRSGLSPARVRRYHSFIRRCLAQGCKWDWVPDNVAQRATPPVEHRPEITIQPADAVLRLIEAAAGSRTPELAVAFRVLAAMGGRRGEVCGLRWADLDLDAGLCAVRRSVKHVGRRLVVGDVKNHQQRLVQLDAGTVQVLAEHRRAMGERADLCGAVLAADAYVLSDAPDGAQPWHPDRLTRALDRLRARAGYTGRLHDLRHWHASQLLTAGEAPLVVAGRLGHRDPSTTHRWYSHAMPRADGRAAKLIGGVLDKVPE